MTTVYPEGLTPDEIDRYLEDRDARAQQRTAAEKTTRDDADVAVMATLPRRKLYAVPDTNTREAIAARIAYDQKPWWERLRKTLTGDRPAGLVDRHPTGQMWTRP